MTRKEVLLSEGYAALPLRATSFGHLEINATVNGVESLFLIDTGAASTVIDTGFAMENSWPVTETEIKGGGVGTSELVIYQLETESFIMGGYPVAGVTLFAADLQHVKQSLLDKGETQIPCGVIGADILFQHKAVIDYENLLLYLK